MLLLVIKRCAFLLFCKSSSLAAWYWQLCIIFMPMPTCLWLACLHTLDACLPFGWPFSPFVYLFLFLAQLYFYLRDVPPPQQEGQFSNSCKKISETVRTNTDAQPRLRLRDSDDRSQRPFSTPHAGASESAWTSSCHFRVKRVRAPKATTINEGIDDSEATASTIVISMAALGRGLHRWRPSPPREQLDHHGVTRSIERHIA
jgi:hypothetical protein